MSKEGYVVKRISKKTAAPILETYHYLKDISKGFKSGFNYGCYFGEALVGVIIFSGFPVPELAKGMLGLARHEQGGLFELSRLCIVPDIQKTEHNIASWFVAKSIALLKQEANVRVILTYADAGYHNGTVYAACNFTYYGLSAPKSDFFFLNDDGTYTKHSRGTVKGRRGEWRARTRKHRFALCFDKTLKIRWEPKKWERKANE